MTHEAKSYSVVGTSTSQRPHKKLDLSLGFWWNAKNGCLCIGILWFGCLYVFSIVLVVSGVCAIWISYDGSQDPLDSAGPIMVLVGVLALGGLTFIWFFAERIHKALKKKIKNICYGSPRPSNLLDTRPYASEPTDSSTEGLEHGALNFPAGLGRREHSPTGCSIGGQYLLLRPSIEEQIAYHTSPREARMPYQEASPEIPSNSQPSSSHRMINQTVSPDQSHITHSSSQHPTENSSNQYQTSTSSRLFPSAANPSQCPTSSMSQYPPSRSSSQHPTAPLLPQLHHPGRNANRMRLESSETLSGGRHFNPNSGYFPSHLSAMSVYPDDVNIDFLNELPPPYTP